MAYQPPQQPGYPRNDPFGSQHGHPASSQQAPPPQQQGLYSQPQAYESTSSDDFHRDPYASEEGAFRGASRSPSLLRLAPALGSTSLAIGPRIELVR